jgi:hypothetical protein
MLKHARLTCLVFPTLSTGTVEFIHILSSGQTHIRIPIKLFLLMLEISALDYENSVLFVQTGPISSSAGLSDAATTSGSASPSRTRWSCKCAPGWHGTQCLSRTTDTCDDKPCHNGGACVAIATSTTTKTEDLVAETGGSTMERYKCSCPAGYSGTNCELEIDECASQPCRNGMCGRTLAVLTVSWSSLL